MSTKTTDTPTGSESAAAAYSPLQRVASQTWLKLGLTATACIMPFAVSAQEEEELLELEAFEIEVRESSRAENILDFTDLNTVLPGTSTEQILDRVPGVNVVSRDPFGFYEFGNDVRVRAFSIDDIGVTFDGVPIGNSSPRYGTPIGRIADPENLTQVIVSQGAGDVTTPAYQALGGSLQFFTADPSEEAGATVSVTYGDFDHLRVFGKYEMGEVYPGLTGYISASHFEFSPRGLVGLGMGEQRRIEAKVKYDLPDGNGSIQFAYSYNDRDDFDTLGFDWQEYEGLETGSVPEGLTINTSGNIARYSRDSSAVVFAAGGYTNYIPGNANESVVVDGDTFSLGSFDYGDLSDNGRNYGPPTFIDPTVDPGAGVNANYYNLWRNGRMDHLYRILADYDFTDEISLSVIPYYQHKQNYGLFGRSNSFASSQVRSAYAADPSRTDIWAQPYYDALGRPAGEDGSFFVDIDGDGVYDSDLDFDVDEDGTIDPESETGLNEAIVEYSSDHALAAPGSTPDNFIPGIPGRTGRDEEFGGYRYGVSASLAWETDVNKLIVGGWYEYDRHITERPNYNLQGNGSVVGWFEYDQFNFLNYSRYLEQEVFQGWVQNTYTAFDGALDIVAGIKLLKLDRDADGFLTIAEWINNTPTSRSTSYEDTFLPQFGLLYRLNDNIELFFNYSENLAVPDAGTITTAGDTFDPDLLAPEYSENFDFGLRADYGDVAFNIQGYYLQYTDRILASAVPLDSPNAGAAGNSRFQNVGGVDSWGLEGSVDWTTPVEGLRVGASFAIQETTFQEDFLLYSLTGQTPGLATGDNIAIARENSSAPYLSVAAPGYRSEEVAPGSYQIYEAIEGNDLGNTPFLTVNADVNYTVSAWTFSLSGKYFDDVYVNTLNTQPLDAYFKFDAGVTYRGAEGSSLEGWTAALRIANLLDEDIAYARGYTDSTGQVVWDRGRQFTFSLTAEF
ncbi:MAG: TonB-dependent receptor [Opitutales bacterium]|nr:TonB-dependent receptor [Opitutales bacterium]